VLLVVVLVVCLKMEKAHSEAKEALCDGGVTICDRLRALRSENKHAADEICAIRVLTEVLDHFNGSTMMEVNSLLESQVDILKAQFPECPGVASGSELFVKFATRLSGDGSAPSGELRAMLVERSRKFIHRLEHSRETIGSLAIPFFRDGCCVLVHGYSRVVLAVIRIAHEHGGNFSVVCTESRPDSMGFRMAAEINELGIPVHVILDSAAAAVMDKIDFVLCGSQIICESGGIINKIGTYQLSLVAKEFGKPFYVAAESFKFQRLYPLCQADIKQSSGQFHFSDLAPSFLFTSPAMSAPREKPFSLAQSSPGFIVSSDNVDKPSKLTDSDLTVSSIGSISTSSSAIEVSSEQKQEETSAKVQRQWSNLPKDFGVLQSIRIKEPLSSDYTDPGHITLLFTDFGVLTPSVVSDELIRMYSWA